MEGTVTSDETSVLANSTRNIRDRPKVSEMRLVKSLPLAFVLEVPVRGTVDDGDLFIVSPSSSAAPEPGHGRLMI